MFAKNSHLTASLLKVFVTILLFITIALNAHAAHSASKTILVLGDSLSAEYGLTRGSGWVALLENRLTEKKMGISVFNASISGETSSGGRARLNDLLSKHKPDIVIIELGGNDALRGFDLKASEANFRALITSVKASKAQVLLVAMKIPPNYGKTYGDQFFGMYAKLAKEMNTALVPFFLDGVADKAELFQADRIHLKAEAHPQMLDNVWGPLSKLLKK